MTYRRYLAYVAGPTNPPFKISNMIKSLLSSIINYEVFHKPSSIENYVQSETDWVEDKIFFIDW